MSTRTSSDPIPRLFNTAFDQLLFQICSLASTALLAVLWPQPFLPMTVDIHVLQLIPLLENHGPNCFYQSWIQFTFLSSQPCEGSFGPSISANYIDLDLQA